jgi:hypothetical protein
MKFNQKPLILNLINFKSYLNNSNLIGDWGLGGGGGGGGRRRPPPPPN